MSVLTRKHIDIHTMNTLTQSHTRVQLQSHSQTSTHMHLTWSHTNVTMHSVTWTCWRIRWRKQAHNNDPHWLTERTHTHPHSLPRKHLNMQTCSHPLIRGHTVTHRHTYMKAQINSHKLVSAEAHVFTCTQTFIHTLAHTDVPPCFRGPSHWRMQCMQSYRRSCTHLWVHTDPHTWTCSPTETRPRIPPCSCIPSHLNELVYIHTFTHNRLHTNAAIDSLPYDVPICTRVHTHLLSRNILKHKTSFAFSQTCSHTHVHTDTFARVWMHWHRYALTQHETQLGLGLTLSFYQEDI